MKEQIINESAKGEVFFVDTFGEVWLLLEIGDKEVLAICREGIESFIPWGRIDAICPSPLVA